MIKKVAEQENIPLKLWKPPKNWLVFRFFAQKNQKIDQDLTKMMKLPINLIKLEPKIQKHSNLFSFSV